MSVLSKLRMCTVCQTLMNTSGVKNAMIVKIDFKTAFSAISMVVNRISTQGQLCFPVHIASALSLSPSAPFAKGFSPKDTKGVNKLSNYRPWCHLRCPGISLLASSCHSQRLHVSLRSPAVHPSTIGLSCEV